MYPAPPVTNIFKKSYLSPALWFTVNSIGLTVLAARRLPGCAELAYDTLFAPGEGSILFDCLSWAGIREPAMSGFYAADKPYRARNADRRRACFLFSSSTALKLIYRSGAESSDAAIASRPAGSGQRFSGSSRPAGRRTGSRRASGSEFFNIVPAAGHTFALPDTMQLEAKKW
jgi:hypothetical protein